MLEESVMSVTKPTKQSNAHTYNFFSYVYTENTFFFFNNIFLFCFNILIFIISAFFFVISNYLPCFFTVRELLSLTTHHSTDFCPFPDCLYCLVCCNPHSCPSHLDRAHTCCYPSRDSATKTPHRGVI